jgi:hypothetical protein
MVHATCNMNKLSYNMSGLQNKTVIFYGELLQIFFNVGYILARENKFLFFFFFCHLNNTKKTLQLSLYLFFLRYIF